MTFWHCECINLSSEAAFTERYRKWCKRKDYHFSPQKAAELYMDSAGHITTLPRNSNTRLLITTAAKELASAKSTLAVLRAEMTTRRPLNCNWNCEAAYFGLQKSDFAGLVYCSLFHPPPKIFSF